MFRFGLEVSLKYIFDKLLPINNYIDSDYGHYQIWNEILRNNEKLYIYEYEDIPRGRIVYKINVKQYIVYANQDIVNSKKCRQLIIETFQLLEKHTVFRFDEHYQI